MGVYGRLAVLAGDLQLVVKEYGVFSERGRRRVVDIREQAAFQGLACNRMEPGRARFFNDDCAEKPMHVGAKLAAAGVRHVGKQEAPSFVAYQVYWMKPPAVVSGLQPMLAPSEGKTSYSSPCIWRDARRFKRL